MSVQYSLKIIEWQQTTFWQNNGLPLLKVIATKGIAILACNHSN